MSDTADSKEVDGELREAVLKGLANHTNEFLNPWFIKGSVPISHEELAYTLDVIMNKSRLFEHLEAYICSKYISREKVAEANKKYFESVLRSRAKSDPNLTVREWSEGHFAKHDYRGAKLLNQPNAERLSDE